VGNLGGGGSAYRNHKGICRIWNAARKVTITDSRRKGALNQLDRLLERDINNRKRGGPNGHRKIKDKREKGEEKATSCSRNRPKHKPRTSGFGVQNPPREETWEPY